MFATMRRRRRNAKMRDELGQSVDHFKRAASIAASETSATVGPRINAAKDRVQPAAEKAKDAASSGWDSALAALTPLVATTTESVIQAGRNGREATRRQLKAERKQARKMQHQAAKRAGRLQRKAEKAIGRKRGGRAGKLAGYALLGTALGVGAAYVARRRTQAQWEEYDAAPNPPVVGADDAAFEPLEPTVYTTANGTATDQANQARPSDSRSSDSRPSDKK
ncbi:hypothetical protein [Actinoplanes sp. NPDC051851]|uniref:hypothetical protein n=1 Tax=Actinoplanes sp. NPDC051851 TaxID=3154753 RepID=UPI0034262C5E